MPGSLTPISTSRTDVPDNRLFTFCPFRLQPPLVFLMPRLGFRHQAYRASIAFRQSGPVSWDYA